jgi:hypothetical protein
MPPLSRQNEGIWFFVTTVQVPPKCREEPGRPNFGHQDTASEVFTREVLADLIVEERNVEGSDLLHGEELMREAKWQLKGGQKQFEHCASHTSSCSPCTIAGQVYASLSFLHQRPFL